MAGTKWFVLRVVFLVALFVWEVTLAEDVLVLSSGSGTPSVTVVRSNGSSCAALDETVPQPYGWPGRIGSISAVSAKGELVICGGLEDSGPPISSFKDCSALDLKERKWSPLPDLPDYVAFSGYAVSPANDHLYTFGGHHTRNLGPGPTEWVYSKKIFALNLTDVKAGWWELSTTLPWESSRLCATPFGKDIFLVGNDVTGRFNVETEVWTNLPSLGISDAGCTILSDEFGTQSLLAVGGSSKTALWRFPLQGKREEGQWREIGPPLPNPRSQRPSVAFLDGQLVVAGGSSVTLAVDVLTEFGWETVDHSLTEARSYQSEALSSAELFPECL